MPGIGTAVGTVGGGIAGYLLGDDPEEAPSYTPSRTNFTYGLGGADYNYGQRQSNSYDKRQGSLETVGAQAYNREGPVQALPAERGFVASQGQGYLQGADAPGRASQIAALGGLQNQVGALNTFANRAQGPSAAQAQLQAGTDAAARQQYGFARSQAGGGGAALRNAAFNAAGISGNAGNTAAMLRAQEDQAYRNQQLQALGAAQQGAGTLAGYSGQLRGMDQGFAQAQAGQANFDATGQNQYNTQQQQFEFGVGQNNQNAALAQGRANDAMYLGTQGQIMGYEGLRNQLAQGNLAAGSSYESARAQGAGLGAANFNAAQQQSNTELAMGLGAAQGGFSTYNQMNPPSKGDAPTSDVRAKTDIKPVSVLEALGGGRSPGYSAADTKALYAQQISGERVRNAVTDAEAVRARDQFDPGMSEFNPGQDRLRALGGGTPDLRGAQGYNYAYRDPERHGEGRYVGPMAQDLEHLPGVVQQGQDGTKAIDSPRLTLANTAAVSEQQRRIDELEAQLQALGGGTSTTRALRTQPIYAQPQGFGGL